MLALFKGELSYNDIMYGMVYKYLIELRSARIQRLVDEQRTEEERRAAREKEKIRNRIMEKDG